MLTPVTHRIRGWVGPRAALDTEALGKILCLYRGSNSGRQVFRQTLYCSNTSYNLITLVSHKTNSCIVTLCALWNSKVESSSLVFFPASPLVSPAAAFYLHTLLNQKLSVYTCNIHKVLLLFAVTDLSLYPSRGKRLFF
jgi:hypothetical protein